MTDRLVRIRFIGDGITTVAGQVTALGKSVGAAADKMTSADKDAAKFRRGLDTTGRAAGKVGLIAAAGLGAIVVATANFDQAMSNVQAATHETADNMEQLRKAAIKTGADTVFSASEAAGAIENLAKAGVSTKDILNGGLNGALSLAAAGGLEVADAAEIAATAMTQFKLSGQDVPHIADLLAAGAGKAQGDVTDMAYALKQAGLVASQAGISIEETTGTLSAFASAGLLGSDAGTSFRTMLLRLTPQSTQAAKAIDRYNLSAFDAQGNFIGLAAYAEKLKTGLSGLTVEQRQSTLATIFGTDAIRAANVLYDQGAKGIGDWTNKVNDSGYAAETASIKMDNLKGDLEQLKGSLETALIGAGEGSQAPLRNLVQGLTDAVNAFNKLPGPMKGLVTNMLAITAVTGGGLWFGSKVIRGITDTRAALGNLGPTASSTATRLGRIGATGAGILVAAQALGALVNATTNLGNSVNSSDISRDLERIANGETTQALGKLSGALEGINEAGAGVTHAIFAIPSALTGIKTSFDTNKDTIEAFDQQLADLVESGNADKAAAAFQAIRDAAAAHGGVSDHDVVRQFDAYKTALDNAADAALGASGAGQLMKDALFGLIPSTTTASGALAAMAANTEAQEKALKASRKAALETATQFVGLGDKVDDADVSLNDWIKDMEKQATALRDFTKNAQTAGKKGLKEGLIAELEKAGPAGALRMKQLADGTKAQIREANKAWRDGQRAINNYVDTIGGVPPSVTTNVFVNSAVAEAAARRIAREIRNIPKQWRTDYYVIQHNALNKPKVLPGTAGQADGGTIPGPRFPYGDRVLTPMAPGEEVISNRHGQADKWRPLLKAINAGMADGGTVGRMPAGALSPALVRSAADPVDRLLGYRDARGALVDALRTVLSDMPVMRAPRDTSLIYGAG